jgi:hypothetical protein
MRASPVVGRLTGDLGVVSTRIFVPESIDIGASRFPGRGRRRLILQPALGGAPFGKDDVDRPRRRRRDWCCFSVKGRCDRLGEVGLSRSPLENFARQLFDLASELGGLGRRQLPLLLLERMEPLHASQEVI